MAKGEGCHFKMASTVELINTKTVIPQPDLYIELKNWHCISLESVSTRTLYFVVYLLKSLTLTIIGCGVWMLMNEPL